MIKNNSFRKKRGKIKNKRYRYYIRKFPEIGLAPLDPMLNIKRNNKISANRKESLSEIRKYHNPLKMKFLSIWGIITRKIRKKRYS